MVGIANFCIYFGVPLFILSAFFPLLLKIFVNNSIEKRHKCKLNVEQENIRYIFLYSYAKYFNPGKTIAMAYLFNSQKMIDKIPSLKAINYNLKTAPKIEIFICVACWIIALIAILCSILLVILTKGFGVNP